VATVADVLAVLDSIAPKRWALPSDHVGLQIGDRDQTVERAAVSLDRSLDAVSFADEIGAQLLLTHHPLIFQPLAEVTPNTHVGKTVLRIATSGMAFIAAHTNWDAAPGGVNDTLAKLLGLEDVRRFGEAAPVAMSKLVFTTPTGHVDKLIDAAANVGAGLLGLYKRCAFQAAGTGSFEPLGGAKPFLGAQGQREHVEEVRVEMTLCSHLGRAAIQAIRQAHPYEEPAIDLYPLVANPEMPLGRIGVLDKPIPLSQFVKQVDRVLATRALAWGDPNRTITTVAAVGGSADDEWAEALAAGADVLVTGEVRQHVAVEASETGLAIVAAGHYATEQPGAQALCETIRVRLPAIEWRLFVPRPGIAGRPFGESA
jgi:dinuclear metal center YbgI/SA1388 family protein